MANRVRPILVSEADRAELERWQRASSTPWDSVGAPERSC